MNRKFVVFVLVVALVLLTALPATAAGWTEKVTGGGQAVAGGTEFSITTSAWEDTEGNVGGQIEYSRSDLSFHAKVECFGLFSGGDVAVAAGPAKVQDDPTGFIGAGEWAVIEILEGGKGSGDRVRVRLMSESAATGLCESPSGTFPGLIYDGNFNIRIK